LAKTKLGKGCSEGGMLMGARSIGIPCYLGRIFVRIESTAL